jgi:RND family efflux transporter MFP subunit
MPLDRGFLTILSAILVSFLAQPVFCSERTVHLCLVDRSSKNFTGSESQNSRKPSSVNKQGFKVDAAVIRPFRTATVGAEVQGVIEKRYFEEGDLVKAGQLVFEISPDLFETVVRRARERVNALNASREKAYEVLKLKDYLLSHNAATKQEVVKARADATIAKHRINEAKEELALALRDLRKCQVKAPFTGNIVSFYREQFEPVQKFDQLFRIADTSKVYAVVNVPESLLKQVNKGAGALFLRPSRKEFRGTVARIGKAIDPSSRTKKVQVLIDNPKGELEMGMLGSVVFGSHKPVPQ